jgi:hypothetical protein
MNDITRRHALKVGGATVAAALLSSDVVQAAPAWNGPAPEPGAQIRVLRWKHLHDSFDLQHTYEELWSSVTFKNSSSPSRAFLISQMSSSVGSR